MEKKPLFLLDPATGERTAMMQLGVRIQALHVEADGTLFGFGEGKVFAWQGSTLKDGFPRGFQGESFLETTSNQATLALPLR